MDSGATAASVVLAILVLLFLVFVFLRASNAPLMDGEGGLAEGHSQPCASLSTPCGTGAPSTTHGDKMADKACDKIPCSVKIQQARLWEDHFQLTRQVVIAYQQKSPCFDELKAELYRNQQQLAENFGAQLQYVGLPHTTATEAKRELAKELTVHIDQALLIVQAASAGKPVDTLVADWKCNADRVAAIYARYLPCVKLSEAVLMMQMHLTTTLAEATAILKGDCGPSVLTGNATLTHIRHMSDYFNGFQNASQAHAGSLSSSNAHGVHPATPQTSCAQAGSSYAYPKPRTHANAQRDIFSSGPAAKSAPYAGQSTYPARPARVPRGTDASLPCAKTGCAEKEPKIWQWDQRNRSKPAPWVVNPFDKPAKEPEPRSPYDNKPF